MNIVKQGFEVWTDINDEDAVLYELARGASLCYKSEDKLNDKLHIRKLLSNILSKKHYSVFRQFFIKVKIITDIGVARQLMRHFPQYPLQESTRYCNYTKNKFNNEVSFIKPFGLINGSKEYKLWYDACEFAEKQYFDMIKLGLKPETARSVLPVSTKTEFILYTHIEKWRHILSIRTREDVQPETRELCQAILTEFKEKLPLLFGDI